MKSLTMAVITGFGVLSNVSMASEMPTLKSDNYEIVMQAVKSACPPCESSLSHVLEAMNQECGFPLTEENVTFVAKSHPVYAFSLAANSMLEGTESVKESFNKALAENVNCWDAQLWIDATKDAMSNDKFQSILTNPNDSQ